MKKAIVILSVIAAILLGIVVILLLTEPAATPAPTPQQGGSSVVVKPNSGNTQQGETTPLTTETEPPETLPPFEPQKTAGSDPANFGFKWEIMADGEIVESYTRNDPITFENNDYFAFPGVPTFRGTNYRTDGSYGTAEVLNEDIKKVWSMNVGYLNDPIWIGCGWTGQPLVVQWDEETRQIMNLHEDKKNKEGLTEVIYAKMDGRVHFFDIEDGSETRKPLKLGMVFKGSGALDPRGYPILYVGSGLASSKGQRIFAVSLIDGSILFEFKGEDPFKLRKFCAFDSSPLVDADTDTLIWPGESGVLYTFKLNTVYDKAAGTISMTPDEPVKTRYTDDYSKAGRNLGYETSAVAVDNYIFVGDNAGMFQCIDLNTMELVWAHDLIDDINATAAFEWEDDGKGYLYVGPSKDYSNGGKNKGDLPLRKIDAATGETVWEVLINCGSYDGCSGGTMGSPMLGRKGTNLEDMVFFAMGRTPGAWDSVIYALDKHTGNIVWQYETKDYTWCSPVGLYTPEGKGYVVQIDNEGRVYLMDGTNGEVKDTFELEAHIEASPVIYNDRLVIGTRESVVILKFE